MASTAVRSPLIAVLIRQTATSTANPGALRAVPSCQHRTFSSYLITPKELLKALKNGEMVRSEGSKSLGTVMPLCAAWFLPNDPEGRTGASVFRKHHIPHARFFDLDAVRDRNSPYPHMLPGPEGFRNAIGRLGIRKDYRIVVYDSAELGLFSAPRVAWMFKIFGHEKVHVLNNYKLWVDEGYPTDSQEPTQALETHYPIPSLNSSKVAEFDYVKELAIHNKDGSAHSVEILDARPEGRWRGTAPEPRPGLPSGHIPGSINVPFSDLLDSKSKALLPAEELRRIFQEKGVDPSKPIISSCGTGVTAAIIDLALQEASYGNQQDRQIYDGSWTEWAHRVTDAEDLIERPWLI